MTSDKQGNVWLGGENELQLCNGGHIVRSWDISKAMKRSRSFIMCLMADSQGNVWLGVEDDGVIKFNTHTQQMERIDIGHAVADIRSFYEDKDGRIWIGSEFGVYIYDHGKVVRPVMENGALGHAVVFSMLEQAGRMLMGTYSKGIIIFDRATGRCDTIATGKGLPSPDINQILTDHEGGLWIATPYDSKTAIHVMVHPDVPPIYFDSEIITTILNNLLSNAIKYTPEGSIDLILQMNGKHVNISVKDTGYGIDRESMPHIFDRYYQAQGKHQASGTGIGLALVKSLADLHEGTITAESEPGNGSKFTFTLLKDNTYPSALHKEDDDKEVINEDSKVISEEAGESDGRPLLLVVEDNDDIRQYIADSMGDDYQIIQAADGHEGVSLATEQIPDIIVSDIMMPIMNGIELTRQLKEDVRTSHIPIILLTAKDSIEDKEEGYDSGADSYLTKPFSARLLQSRIQNLLANRRRLAELITLKNSRDPSDPVIVQELADEPRLNRLDQEFMDKLNRIIEEHISTEDLDMAFMTDKMAMSHSTFYRKVKALTGMSAKEYIRKLRQRCAELLRRGNYNVTEAATMTGFNDLGHFREIFKQEFGVAPSEYLKRTLHR